MSLSQLLMQLKCKVDSPNRHKLDHSISEVQLIDFYGVLEDSTTELGKRIDLLEVSELKESSAVKFFIEQEGVVLYECERQVFLLSQKENENHSYLAGRYIP